MSEDSPLFYLGAKRQPDLLTGLKAAAVLHANGDTHYVDVSQTPLQIVEEHPPVDRMEGDWGAICEVYRKKSDYYITGVPLSPGDVITLTYFDSRVIVLKVIELEGKRARVEQA